MPHSGARPRSLGDELANGWVLSQNPPKTRLLTSYQPVLVISHEQLMKIPQTSCRSKFPTMFDHWKPLLPWSRCLEPSTTFIHPAGVTHGSQPAWYVPYNPTRSCTHPRTRPRMRFCSCLPRVGRQNGPRLHASSWRSVKAANGYLLSNGIV